MSLLVLQIVIKQWDKSRRTDAHVLQRAAIPNAYPLIFPPAFYVFDDQCIIDQHGCNVNIIGGTASSNPTGFIGCMRKSL